MSDCSVGGRRAGACQQFRGDRVGNNRRRRVQLIVGNRLRRNRHRARDRTTDARHAFLVRRMLAIGLAHDQHADRAVRLRVQDFHARRGVTRVAGSVEDGVRIGFLRLVIEEQNDFSVHIDAAVVVVVEFGRGDAVSGEDDRSGNVDVGAIGAGGIGKLPLLLGTASALQRDVGSRAIAAIFDQRHGLQIAVAVGGLEAGFREFGGDPLNGDFVAGLQRHSALQRVRR